MIEKYWDAEIIWNRYEYMIKKCKNKSVLDIGCIGNIKKINNENISKWYHHKISNNARKVLGIDINYDMIKKLQNIGYNVEYYDLSKKKLTEREIKQFGKYEIILLGEVIEHIENQSLFFDNINKLLAKNGKIIITTPNASSLVFFISGLLRKKRVHEEHLFLHSIESLYNLLNNLGYKIIDWKYYTASEKFKLMKKIAFSLSSHLAVGLIVEVRQK